MIFSIAMGAKYLFCMKSIETHARAYLALIILGIGTVGGFQGLSLSYITIGPITLELFCPSVIRGPCFSPLKFHGIMEIFCP
mgnify:CR=1 FL=1